MVLLTSPQTMRHPELRENQQRLGGSLALPNLSDPLCLTRANAPYVISSATTPFPIPIRTGCFTGEKCPRSIRSHPIDPSQSFWKWAVDVADSPHFFIRTPRLLISISMVNTPQPHVISDPVSASSAEMLLICHSKMKASMG